MRSISSLEIRRDGPLIVVLGCVAVAAKAPVDTSVFAGADRVHIIGNDTAGTNQDSRDISNREQMDALYRLVSSGSGKWYRIRFDAPLLRWNIEFFRDGKSRGSYGVGANFIEMYPYAHPCSRSSSGKSSSCSILRRPRCGSER